MPAWRGTYPEICMSAPIEPEVIVDADTVRATAASAPAPNERSVLKKARRLFGRLPFVRDVVASWYATLDPNTPTSAKMVLAAAIAYFVMPLDLIPDFIVGIGFTDDAAAIALAIKTLSGIVNRSHYNRADEVLGQLPAAPRNVVDLDDDKSSR